MRVLYDPHIIPIPCRAVCSHASGDMGSFVLNIALVGLGVIVRGERQPGIVKHPYPSTLQPRAVG